MPIKARHATHTMGLANGGAQSDILEVAEATRGILYVLSVVGATTLQPQASNDGGTTWFNYGASITISGLGSTAHVIDPLPKDFRVDNTGASAVALTLETLREIG